MSALDPAVPYSCSPDLSFYGDGPPLATPRARPGKHFVPRQIIQQNPPENLLQICRGFAGPETGLSERKTLLEDVCRAPVPELACLFVSIGRGRESLGVHFGLHRAVFQSVFSCLEKERREMTGELTSAEPLRFS